MSKTKRMLKILSWTVVFSLLLFLLPAVPTAYGSSYYSINLPVLLAPEFVLDWIGKLNVKGFPFLFIKGKIVSERGGSDVVEQNCQIGRGPPPGRVIFNE